MSFNIFTSLIFTRVRQSGPGPYIIIMFHVLCLFPTMHTFICSIHLILDLMFAILNFASNHPSIVFKLIDFSKHHKFRARIGPNAETLRKHL